MLRAAVLHPVLRGIRRFSTSSHPEALGACYVASWQLPRPDLHRSADDDFSGHTMRLFGGIANPLLWFLRNSEITKAAIEAHTQHVTAIPFHASDPVVPEHSRIGSLPWDVIEERVQPLDGTLIGTWR
jgi:hypothetical protein